MKKENIEIGAVYTAKVTGRIVPIQILAENPHGGWDGVNQSTNKRVHIKSAQRLRHRVPDSKVPKEKSDTPQTAAVRPNSKSTPKSIQNAKPRPKAVAYGDVTLAIQDAAYAAIQGQKDPQTALNDLQTKLQTLIK